MTLPWLSFQYWLPLLFTDPRKWFLAFFIVTAIAIYFSRHAIARGVYLVIFIAILLDHGIKGNDHWPFVSWHLFGKLTTTELNFYEFRLSDKFENEIVYDPRAIGPVLNTPLKRYAKRMVIEFGDSRNKEFAEFLFRKACCYRRYINSGFLAYYYLKFPPHQMGFKWSKTLLNNIHDFESIRIYKLCYRMSHNADKVNLISEKLISEFRFNNTVSQL